MIIARLIVHHGASSAATATIDMNQQTRAAATARTSASSGREPAATIKYRSVIVPRRPIRNRPVIAQLVRVGERKVTYERGDRRSDLTIRSVETDMLSSWRRAGHIAGDRRVA